MEKRNNQKHYAVRKNKKLMEKDVELKQVLRVIGEYS